MPREQPCNFALGTIPLRARVSLERQKKLTGRFDIAPPQKLLLYVRGARQVQLIRKAWEKYGRTGTTLQSICGKISVDVLPFGIRWNRKQTFIRMELYQRGEVKRPIA